MLYKLLTIISCRGQAKPEKTSTAMFLSCREISNIKVAIRINLYTLTIFLVFFIFSLIDFAFSRHTNSSSLAFPIFDESKKDFTLIFHKFKIEMSK